MNWRRGLLLAGIHLAVAAPLMLWAEHTYWPIVRSNVNEPTQIEIEQLHQDILWINPCWEGVFVDRVPSPLVAIETTGNLPIAFLSGWHVPCDTASRIDKVVERRLGRTRRSEIIIVSVICTGTAIQWLLVGGLPLVRPRRRWLEPGVFITVCTVLGVALAFIPYVSVFSWILALLAVLAWFWWFGLLIWKSIRFTWRRITAKPA